jgi:hypothetical protein
MIFGSKLFLGKVSTTTALVALLPSMLTMAVTLWLSGDLVAAKEDRWQQLPPEAC